MRTFKRHDEECLQKIYEVWGDEQAYGLKIRENVEQLEQVLRDDNGEQDEEFREALERLQGAEFRRLKEDET
jgi:hypothetical protein